MHKTLSGLDQTSALSVGSDRIDSEKLPRVLELEESASASTLLLSSAARPGGRARVAGEGTDAAPLPSRRELRTEQAMLPRDAFLAATEPSSRARPPAVDSFRVVASEG